MFSPTLAANENDQAQFRLDATHRHPSSDEHLRERREAGRLLSKIEASGRRHAQNERSWSLKPTARTQQLSGVHVPLRGGPKALRQYRGLAVALLHGQENPSTHTCAPARCSSGCVPVYPPQHESPRVTISSRCVPTVAILCSWVCRKRE